MCIRWFRQVRPWVFVQYAIIVASWLPSNLRQIFINSAVEVFLRDMLGPRGILAEACEPEHLVETSRAHDIGGELATLSDLHGTLCC